MSYLVNTLTGMVLAEKSVKAAGLSFALDSGAFTAGFSTGLGASVVLLGLL